MWKTTKVICAFFTASRKPISRRACSVGDIKPGANIDHRDTGVCGRQRVDDPHLIGHRGGVDDFGVSVSKARVAS
jgi:hypothetical protein